VASGLALRVVEGVGAWVSGVGVSGVKYVEVSSVEVSSVMAGETVGAGCVELQAVRNMVIKTKKSKCFIS